MVFATSKQKEYLISLLVNFLSSNCHFSTVFGKYLVVEKKFQILTPFTIICYVNIKVFKWSFTKSIAVICRI